MIWLGETLLVLPIRCGVLYGLLVILNRPHDLWTVLALCAAAAVTLGTALRCEALRGAMARDGTYIGIDVAGPSRLQIVTLACIESCFYFAGLYSVLLWLLAIWLPLLGVLFIEILLLLYRVRVVIIDEGIVVAPLASRKVLRWSGLRVEHDGVYFRLRSGAAAARFRLAPFLMERFTGDLTKRGIVVHAVKPARGMPWGHR